MAKDADGLFTRQTNIRAVANSWLALGLAELIVAILTLKTMLPFYLPPNGSYNLIWITINRYVCR